MLVIRMVNGISTYFVEGTNITLTESEDFTSLQGVNAIFRKAAEDVMGATVSAHAKQRFVFNCLEYAIDIDDCGDFTARRPNVCYGIWAATIDYREEQRILADAANNK